MTTPEITSKDAFLIEIEKVVHDAKNHPMLVGRVVAGSIELPMQHLDQVEVRSETLGGIVTQIKRADRVSETGDVLEENIKEIKPGFRVSVSLLGDPIKTVPSMGKLHIGTFLLQSKEGEAVVQKAEPVSFGFNRVVVSGCMISAALFLLFFMVILGMPELGIMAIIIDLILVGMLIGGLVLLLRPVVKWIRLKRNPADTIGRVVDKKLTIWEDNYGNLGSVFTSIIEFKAQQAGGLVKPFILSLDGKKPYERFAIGSSVNVHYAVDDPRVAQVEKE
jgi:hypothetical protein